MPVDDDSLERLRRRLEYWARRLKVVPRVVRIQQMTRKWGSCSSRGTVTVASDLAARPRRFQDFVMVHELLHLRVPNHGKLFKALMSVHVPDWKHQNLARSGPKRTKPDRT